MPKLAKAVSCVPTRLEGLRTRRLAFSTMNAAGLAKAVLITRTATKTAGSQDVLWSIV